MVEIEYLISLSEQKEVKELEPMSETDKQKLRKIYNLALKMRNELRQ